MSVSDDGYDFAESRAAGTASDPINPQQIMAFAGTLFANGDNWRSAWAQAASFGLLRGTMPEATGGGGQSASRYIDTMLALGEDCDDNGFTMGLASQLWTLQQSIATFGNDTQQARYLPDLMSGRTLGSFALTEAASGSDALNLRTTAERHDGGYVLNGAKTFIGMAPDCDVALVFASTSPEHGTWGLSAFLVEAGDAGFQRDGDQAKIGLKTLPMGGLRFVDCWVPENRRLGPEGAGARIVQAALDWERCFILAPHVGAMARQLRDCSAFARDREVFGQPISAYQSVSNRIADMRLRLETARLMLRRAAELYDTGGPLTEHAALTNLHLSEAFLASSMDAFRIHGGRGYLADGAGADVADAMGGVIYSGTSDLQRQIIARLTLQTLTPTADTRATRKVAE